MSQNQKRNPNDLKSEVRQGCNIMQQADQIVNCKIDENTHICELKTDFKNKYCGAKPVNDANAFRKDFNAVANTPFKMTKPSK